MFPVFKLSPCYVTYKSFILRAYIISEIISENLQVTLFTYLLSLMFFFLQLSLYSQLQESNSIC